MIHSMIDKSTVLYFMQSMSQKEFDALSRDKQIVKYEFNKINGNRKNFRKERMKGKDGDK